MPEAPESPKPDASSAAPAGAHAAFRDRDPPRDEQYYDGRFATPARWLLARGVHPNHFTFAQLPLFALQILAAVSGWRWTFVLLAYPLIILDAGDGILARVGRLQSK